MERQQEKSLQMANFPSQEAQGAAWALGRVPLSQEAEGWDLIHMGIWALQTMQIKRLCSNRPPLVDLTIGIEECVGHLSYHWLPPRFTPPNRQAELGHNANIRMGAVTTWDGFVGVRTP